MMPESKPSRATRERVRSERASTGQLLLLLTPQQWGIAFAAGVLLALAFVRGYWNVSPWVGAAWFIVGVVVVHLRYAGRYCMPFPHIAMLIAALQYVFAAWLADDYPATNPVYNIGNALRFYLTYTGPVLVALFVGWALAFYKLPWSIATTHLKPVPGLLFALDVLLVVGFASLLLRQYFGDSSLAFVLVLAGNLRYIGVHGRMLCRQPGWEWRLLLVVGTDILFAAGSAMFHTLVLWGMWTFAVWVRVFKPSWTTVIAAGAAAVILILPLQEAKWNLREDPYQDVNPERSLAGSIEKTGIWLNYLGKSIVKEFKGQLDEDFIGDILVRYNQGWIICRIMEHVPAEEPYAKGKTLQAAVEGALLPRVFAPNKEMAGGRAKMEKYAGIALNENTSMNLGFAGEMYANFGWLGGIIGCGCYAALLGVLYRGMSLMAFKSALWWSLLPFVGFSAMKAEDGIGEVLNWIVKACVFLVGICIVFPSFRHALFPDQAGARPSLRRRRYGKRSDKVAPVATAPTTES